MFAYPRTYFEDPLRPYDIKPKRFLSELTLDKLAKPESASYCAGFEIETWRCDDLADHLIEWLADYALKEDELSVDHGNMYVRLRQAAARIYKSEKYQTRGEVGEIVLHAICREFFDTIPIAPRVFYLTSSNEVVKSFDLVHVRYVEDAYELWLGEAKFFENRDSAVNSAIESISKHIGLGFLKNEKLILGPQISRHIPRYHEIRDLLSSETSLDKLFESAVFPVCIACDSETTASASCHDEDYSKKIKAELQRISAKIVASGLCGKIRMVLIYVPLASKGKLAEAFDKRLKGLTP